MITHEVTHGGKKRLITSRLYPVYYLPGLSHRLLSVGHLLNDGLELKGSSSSLEFSAKTPSTKWPLMQFKPYFPGQNIYWLSARLTSRHAILAKSSVTSVDYDIMHRHLPILARMFYDMHQEIHRISLVICRSLLLILSVKVVLKER